MEVPSEYEIKFHVYDGNELEPEFYVNEFNAMRNELRNDGSVGSKVTSYFFDGMIALATADKLYWEGKQTQSYSQYQEAQRMFNRFKNSRNLNARIDLLNERLISRCQGLLKISDAQATSDTNLKSKLMSEALTKFNEEVASANSMNETMSSYAAFARAAFVESQILRDQAFKLKESDNREAKKAYFKVRYSLRQAAFIDKRYVDSLDIIEAELDELTKNRLLMKAEKLADDATVKSEDGLYMEAKQLFSKATLFHRRASTLASDTGSRRKLLSTATLYEASIYEADANKLFKADNNTWKASELYSEAGKQVDKAIALLGHFGTKDLVDSFASQSNYYKAMSLQTKAINEFDSENYPEAKSLFDESAGLFKQAVGLAAASKNNTIEAMGNEAIGDINGYLSICEALI